MHVSWMRWFDDRLGPPLVAASGLVRRLTKPHRRPDRPARILVVKFWGIGSLVQAIPSFRALREHYPDAELHLLTLRGNERLFAGDDLFHRTLTLDIRSAGRFLLNGPRLMARVWRGRYDLLLNYEGFARFGIILGNLSHAGQYVAFSTPHHGVADVTAPFRGDAHISEVFGELTASVGAPPSDFEPHLRLSPEARRAADGFRAAHGIGADDWLVAINVNAGPISPARRWPRERYVALGQRLLQCPQTRVVLVGGPEEVEYVGAVARALGDRALNLAGQTSLQELIGVLADVDLLVTNDTGPLHLAVALGHPTVSFFGPESPRIYGPRGEQHRVLYRGLSCSPCLTFENLKRTDCDHFSCLREITVDDAWQAVVAQRQRWAVARGFDHLLDPEWPVEAPAAPTFVPAAALASSAAEARP